MRRTASEVLHELEVRVARLERLGSVSRDLARRLTEIAENLRTDFELSEIEKALPSAAEDVFKMNLDDVKDFQVLGVARGGRTTFYVTLKLKPIRGRAVTKTLEVENYGVEVAITQGRMPSKVRSTVWLDGHAKAKGDDRISEYRVARDEHEAGLARFLRSAIVPEHEMELEDLTEEATSQLEDLYVVPLSKAQRKIRVKKESIFEDRRGSEFVIIIKESTPLIGVTALVTSESLLEHRLLQKLLDSEGLKAQYADSNLSRRLWRAGLASLLVNG